jgi:hypothetical protein
MKFSRNSFRLPALLFLLQLSGYHCYSQPVVYVFNGLGSANYQDPLNWLPYGPPSNADIAVFPTSADGTYHFDLGSTGSPPTLWFDPSEVKDVYLSGIYNFYPWATPGFKINGQLVIGASNNGYFGWYGDGLYVGPKIWGKAFDINFDNATLIAQKMVVGTTQYLGTFSFQSGNTYAILDTLSVNPTGTVNFSYGGYMIINNQLSVSGNLDLGSLAMDLRGIGTIAGNLTSGGLCNLKINNNHLSVTGNLDFEPGDRMGVWLCPGNGYLSAGGFSVMHVILDIDSAVNGSYKIFSGNGGIADVTIGHTPQGTSPSDFTITTPGNYEIWVNVNILPVSNHDDIVKPVLLAICQNGNLVISGMDAGGGTIRIVDLCGRLINSTYCPANHGEINLYGYKGVFLLQYTGGKGCFCKKILID